MAADILLSKLEEHFLMDYMAFGRRVLPEHADVLFREYSREADHGKKKRLMVGLLTTWMQQHEQVAAWLMALQARRLNGQSVVVTVVNYKIGEAVLRKVIPETSTGTEFLSMLGIDARKVSNEIGDSEVVERRALEILEGLSVSAAYQDAHSKFYNKAKHGMAIVGRWPDHQGAIGALIRPTEIEFIESHDDLALTLSSLTRKLGDILGDLVVFLCMDIYPHRRDEIRGLAESGELGVPTR